MKIKLISLLFMLLAVKLVAQVEFAPLGTKWKYVNPYYVYKGQTSNDEYWVNIESVKDTIIQARNCRVLEFSYSGSNRFISREYVWQTGDSILYYNYYDSGFHLLYNFGAKAGDTVIVHQTTFKPTKGFLTESTIPGFVYRVTSVGGISMFDGNTFRRQSVSRVSEVNISSNSWAFVCGEIDEPIGHVCYFFGRYSLRTDDNDGTLAGYSSNPASCPNPQFIAHDGWDTPYYLDCSQPITNVENKLMPTVTVQCVSSNNILIKNTVSADGTEVQIYDMLGRQVTFRQSTENEDVIQITIPKIYNSPRCLLLKITQQNRRISTYKLLTE